MELARAKRATDPHEIECLVVQASLSFRKRLTNCASWQGVCILLRCGKGFGGSITALAERSTLPVEVDLGSCNGLPAHVELAAYFICAEAVTNATKYAEASSVRICIDGNEREMRMEIVDNGIGGAQPGPDGGLLGVADRAAALGGTLSIDSPEGKGTTIRAILPFSTDPERDVP